MRDGHDAHSALELRGLRQSFSYALGLRRREVLRGIDLTLPRGAFLGLAGPNGSGKSSLLRCIAGIDRPRSGSANVLGGSPQESRVRARIGYLPEESPFPGELSARAALALLGSLQGMPRARIRERSATLLEQVGLTPHARRPLRAYSRGMKRRFGLAQAWLHEPDLILLDEPTAGLDAQGYVALEELLLEARARGASVVLASHLLADLERHCDALAVLVGGEIAAFGAPGEILGRPGRWRVELDGADEALIAELAGWARREGATVVEVKPSGRSLLEVYRASGGSLGDR